MEAAQDKLEKKQNIVVMHEFAIFLFEILAKAICQTVCQLSFRSIFFSSLLFYFISLRFWIGSLFVPCKCLCKSLTFSFHLICLFLKFSQWLSLNAKCNLTIFPCCWIPLRFCFSIRTNDNDNDDDVDWLMCVTCILQCRIQNWTKYILTRRLCFDIEQKFSMFFWLGGIQK